MNEREELLALHEWMREPDWAENFSLEDMANWINRRPTHVTARLATAGPAQTARSQTYPATEPAAYRWRPLGALEWIYDPTLPWIQDHKHEVEIEPLYTTSVSSTPGEPVQAASGCICQDQHRRGYCTEPGCPYSRGLGDIAAERQRQIEVRGWSSEHDDAHHDGSIATAAAVYALHPFEWHLVVTERSKRRLLSLEDFWPWDIKRLKLKDRRRNLVKAGAPIAAEIDRLDRASPLPSTNQSAPVQRAPHNHGERLPNGDTAGAGADTRLPGDVGGGT
jgi:hypothetical protein